MHEVYRDDKGRFNGWSEYPISLADDSAKDLGALLVLASEAMVKPVLEIVNDGNSYSLSECLTQPEPTSIPQSDHWQKVVSYEKDRTGKIIDHRRTNDKLYLVKIRDYSLPIAAFKAEDNVEFVSYYVARGDGLITASYSDSQVTSEKLITTKK